MQSEGVKLDELFQLFHDGVCVRGSNGGGDRGCRKEIPGGESLSQLELGLFLVEQAAGFRFLPGCQGFQ